MTDDLDVEELLEAPFKKGEDYKLKENGVDDKGSRSNKKKRKHSRSRSRDRDKKDKDKDRGKDRRRSRDKDRKRSRSRDRKRSSEGRSKSKEKKRRSGDRYEKRRSPSPIRRGRRRTPSPLRDVLETLTPEERDARTVFCMQLSQRVRVRDLEDFFSAVGKIRDVKLITDTKTGRSKGIAYVEFAEIPSVSLALGLSGQKLLGVPIICQLTHAEKNRIAAASSSSIAKGITGPMRLYVGSLHFNITEEMLRGIFEPFGKIDNIQLIMDPETGRSKGYGFITF